MNDFNFLSNTKIIFGNDKEKEVGKIIKEYGFKKIAFVYGKGSIKSNGLYDSIVKSLNDNNIEFIELFNVEANPKLSKVIEFKNKIKDKNIDMILAVGGGSVLDASKLLSYTYYYEGNPFDFNEKKTTNFKHLPVGTILTIAASGSDLSNSCVITNDLVTPFVKKGFNTESNRPLFSILSPKLTYTVSPYQTACGIVDIMMHSLERYFDNTKESELADSFALGLIKTVMENGITVMNEPDNYQARAELLLANGFSHNGLTSIGKNQFMRVHGIEHILSGLYDEVAHGAGLSILFPAWALYCLDNESFNKQASKLSMFLFNEPNPRFGILKLRDFFRLLNMPTKISDLNLKEFDEELFINEYVKNNKSVDFDFKVLDKDAIKSIIDLSK